MGRGQRVCGKDAERQAATTNRVRWCDGHLGRGGSTLARAWYRSRQAHRSCRSPVGRGAAGLAVGEAEVALFGEGQAAVLGGAAVGCGLACLVALGACGGSGMARGAARLESGEPPVMDVHARANTPLLVWEQSFRTAQSAVPGPASHAPGQAGRVVVTGCDEPAPVEATTRTDMTSNASRQMSVDAMKVLFCRQRGVGRRGRAVSGGGSTTASARPAVQRGGRQSTRQWLWGAPQAFEYSAACPLSGLTLVSLLVASWVPLRNKVMA